MDAQALVAEHEERLTTVRALNAELRREEQRAREAVDRALTERDNLSFRLRALEKENEDLKVQLADVPLGSRTTREKMRDAFGTGVEWLIQRHDLLNQPTVAEVDAAFVENFPEFK